MLSRRPYGNSKNAEITIEITLSLALSVVVLFFALALFSDNLETLAANNPMRNLFDKDKTIAKTSYVSSAVDPTATQVNVSTVGDHGLDWYLANARTTLDKYKSTPPASLAQAEDLARAATILKVHGNLGDDEISLSSGGAVFGSDIRINILPMATIGSNTYVEYKTSTEKLSFPIITAGLTSAELLKIFKEINTTPFT